MAVSTCDGPGLEGQEMIHRPFPYEAQIDENRDALPAASATLRPNVDFGERVPEERGSGGNDKASALDGFATLEFIER